MGSQKSNTCFSELWLVSRGTEMELFCVWCQVSATYLHRREIQRVHNNWWWMLSFEPFAHFCCVGKITILKYASASPKVGSILLRCDVGGWEDVSSFATLLFELCTISILLFWVEEAYPCILSKLCIHLDWQQLVKWVSKTSPSHASLPAKSAFAACAWYFLS